MNGTIMRITKEKMVVLGEDGKFHNMAVPDPIPALGDRVPIEQSKPKPQAKVLPFKMPRFLVAAVLLVACLGMSLVYTQYNASAMPTTLVAVDINPSLELMVNKDGIVKEVIFKNGDANKLLTADDLIGKDIYAAMGSVIGEARQQGYLDAATDKKIIMISVVDLKKIKFRFNLKKVPGNKDDYIVKVSYPNQADKKNADQIGLTVNKYLVYQKAYEQGVKIDVQYLRDHSVANSLKHMNIKPKEFFRELSEEENYGDQRHGKRPGKQGNKPRNNGNQPDGEDVDHRSKGAAPKSEQHPKKVDQQSEPAQNERGIVRSTNEVGSEDNGQNKAMDRKDSEEESKQGQQSDKNAAKDSRQGNGDNGESKDRDAGNNDNGSGHGGKGRKE